MNKKKFFINSIFLLFIFLSILFAFSSNINLILISYISMNLSFYIQFNSNTDTNRSILNSISLDFTRFFYFFAIAYHGLFPVWFMVFFFFRDIVVAYVRIFASFSGKVMGARFSGKLKGAVQFGGQYLLMYALMINVIQEGGVLSDSFLFWSAIVGLGLNVALLLIFKIKGKLLGIIVGLMIILLAMLFNLKNIHFSINYLTTFSVSFVVIAVTLYSLVDYIFSLEGNVKSIYKIIASFIMIVTMFIISPYFLDLVKNKFESNAESIEWKSNDDFHETAEYHNRGIVAINNFILVVSTIEDKQSRLFVYKNEENNIEFYKSIELPSYLTQVKDIEFDGEYLYVIDDLLNKVYKLNLIKIINENIFEVVEEFNTGFTSSATLATVMFNNEKFIVINDYIYSGHLFFCKSEYLTGEKTLKNQTSFKVKSEFYIKNLFCKGNDLYVLTNKLGKDLIYKINVTKAVYNGEMQPAIERIILAPDSDLKGITIMDNKLISYGNRSKKVYISE